MLAALASAALIVAGSLAVGQAVLVLCGRAERSLLAGPVGLALLLFLSSLVANLGGRGLAIALVLVASIAAACAYLAARWRPGGAPRIGGPAAGALITGLLAALPFIAAGAVGILGVGLVNDDMASHLLIADWIDERFRPEPVFIDQGYPLGPHALVAGTSTLLGASSIDVFAGLTIAIPILAALVAYSAMSGVGTVARALAAPVVALPYMAAAYLAQEAFKEPILALFVLGFALLLPAVRAPRDAVPLGILAAGAVYVYSFPGLAWLAGTLAIWAAIRLWRGERPSRAAGVALALGFATLAVLVVAELPRLVDFVDFRALHPDRANDGGLGNLREQISPLTALGIWPTSEFRLAAGAGSLPAAAFYLGALVAATALVLALPRWIRRHGTAVPAALATAALLYLVARTFGTVYTSAKALAIAAPLIALVTLGGLLAAGRRALFLLGAAVGIAVALSSFLVLRQAPVAPEDHMDELAEIRPVVEGEKLLFLGRDNFVLYELRGSKPFTAVKNYYDPFYVRPNTKLADVFAKFDFDSVDATTLSRFPYVLTTRAPYASGPPPGYEAVKQTESYVLWKQGGSVAGREPAETDAEPGRLDGCPSKRPFAVASFIAPPVTAEPWDATTIEGGETATATLRLRAGDWDLSLAYDSTRPLTLSSPGYKSVLPGNLDYRGPSPFWPAGTVEMPRAGEITITAEVDELPLSGRLLGGHPVAHLGELAATAAGGLADRRSSCRGYVDWYVR